MNQTSARLKIVLGAFIVVGGGYSALTFQENHQLHLQVIHNQEELKTLSAQTDALRSEKEELLKKTQQLSDELSESAKLLSEAKMAAKKAAETPKAPTVSAAPPSPGKSAKGMGEMMKNPAIREIAKQQQIAMIDMQYGDLFSKLKLNDAEKADFKALIGEKISGELDSGMKFLDPNMTPEQRQAALKELTDAKDSINTRIKAFLNNEGDYNTYTHFEETKGDRAMLNMGKSAFASEPLSADQEQQLVDLMHSVSMRPSTLPNLNKPENFDPTKLTPDVIDQQLTKLQRDQELVREQSWKFLSPAQQQALVKMQEQLLSLTKAGMEMQKTMFGGQNK